MTDTQTATGDGADPKAGTGADPAPAKAGAPIEVYSGEEFVGVLHRDEEDGEVSYDLHISILAEDLE